MKPCTIAVACMAWSQTVSGQNHELAFTLGGTAIGLKSALKAGTTSGNALQVSYGYRLWSSKLVALFGEVHMLANPQRGLTGGPLLTKWVSLRGEIRDFYTGLPALNVATIRGGTHNVIASCGFVLSFGKWTSEVPGEGTSRTSRAPSRRNQPTTG